MAPTEITSTAHGFEAQSTFHEPDIPHSLSPGSASPSTENVPTRRAAQTKEQPGDHSGSESLSDDIFADLSLKESAKKLRQKATRIEVKLFEEVVDSQGYPVLKALKTVTKKKVAKWQEYVLCVIHIFNAQRRLVSRSLRINSQIIKDILKRVIVDYPGISFQTEDIELELPAYCLYHYLPHLKSELAIVIEDTETYNHLKLFVDFIEKEFERALSEGKNLLQQQLITYDLLWIIFKPKEVMFAQIHSIARAFDLISVEYLRGMQPKFRVQVSYTDFDGKRFGTRSTTFDIQPFSGSVSIQNLSILPLDYHERGTRLRGVFLERGKRFEQFKTVQCCEYNGVLFEETKQGRYGPSDITKFEVTGRVMVDTKSYSRVKANFAFDVQPFPKPKILVDDDEVEQDLDDSSSYRSFDSRRLEEEVIEEQPPLTDEQCLVASPLVCGFSFHGKRWVHLIIDNISLVKWNENAFDQLVLPESRKQLVRALVQTHAQGRSTFDDIIKGKGKGLVFILHGPPGVGKTLTAECVAEHCKRPLYMVSSGELGTDPESLEQRLQGILDIAAVWNAVLLIDEADIFLEKRTLNDVQRNSLVSIFLKLLEYYEGILFLTTNRIHTFDEAFRSRIDVALKFSDLDSVGRQKIWRTLLEKVGDVDIEIDDGDFEILAQFPTNGRQIKNAIKTGECLAKYREEPLGIQHLEEVLTLQNEFDEHFKSVEY